MSLHIMYQLHKVVALVHHLADGPEHISTLSLPIRSTPTRVQSHAAAEWINYDVQTFGSSLPVKVMEALTMADGKGRGDLDLLFVFCLSGFVKDTDSCSLCCPSLSADDQISVKVNESGWAWMVCGERLIIWKICQTAVAKV